MNDTISPRLNRLNEAVFVAAIDYNGLYPGAEANQPVDKWNSPILILDIRCSNVYGKQTTVDVYSNVPFAANHLFAFFPAS